MRDIAGEVWALVDEMRKAGGAARVPPIWIDRFDALRAKFPAQREEAGLRETLEKLRPEIEAIQTYYSKINKCQCDASVGYACDEHIVQTLLCRILSALFRPAPDPAKLPSRCKVCGEIIEPKYLSIAEVNGFHYTKYGRRCTGELETFDRRGEK